MEIPLHLQQQFEESQERLRDKLRDDQIFGIKYVGVDLDSSEGTNLPTDIEIKPQTEIIQEP